MKTIRLMLVDDHEVVRTGLKSYLETQDGLLVVAEAGSGEEALQIGPSVMPDVIIMDITMPHMDGLEATRRLKTLCPSAHILALTVHEDKQYFFEMLKAGASGYISKQAAADELVAAIHTIMQDQVYLQPSLARWLLEDYRRLSGLAIADEAETHVTSELQKESYALSRRERQVLELVAEGRTTPQISTELGISPKTVARHRERIMSKLNIHSSTELVKFAIRSGLIDL